MEFKSCPSYPFYSVSLCGVVRCDRPYAGPKNRGIARVLRVQRDGTVFVRARRTRIADLIEDAFGIAAPSVERLRHTSGPLRGKFAARPTYEDGRIVSVAELRKMQTEV